jgi:hypothetical protein
MKSDTFNSSDFFAGISNSRKAKKHWLSLAKHNHPKVGGNIELMQNINFQYFNWQVKNNPKYTEQQEAVDFIEYSKLLKKTFSDSDWLLFFRNPEITDVTKNIYLKTLLKAEFPNTITKYIFR